MSVQSFWQLSVFLYQTRGVAFLKQQGQDRNTIPDLFGGFKYEITLEKEKKPNEQKIQIINGS